jgi:hypothetical protein
LEGAFKRGGEKRKWRRYLFGRSVELDVEFQKFVHTSARTMTC